MLGRDMRDADMLQAMEHLADQIDRLSTVLERLIEAQQRGETIDPVIVEDYAAQLRTVRGQREQLRKTIATFWALIGQGDAH